MIKVLCRKEEDWKYHREFKIEQEGSKKRKSHFTYLSSPFFNAIASKQEWTTKMSPPSYSLRSLDLHVHCALYPFENAVYIVYRSVCAPNHEKTCTFFSNRQCIFVTLFSLCLMKLEKWKEIWQYLTNRPQWHFFFSSCSLPLINITWLLCNYVWKILTSNELSNLLSSTNTPLPHSCT